MHCLRACHVSQVSLMRLAILCTCWEEKLPKVGPESARSYHVRESTEREANAKKRREENNQAMEVKTDQVQMALSEFSPAVPDIIPASGVFSYRKLYIISYPRQFEFRFPIPCS